MRLARNVATSLAVCLYLASYATVEGRSVVLSLKRGVDEAKFSTSLRAQFDADNKSKGRADNKIIVDLEVGKTFIGMHLQVTDQMLRTLKSNRDVSTVLPDGRGTLAAAFTIKQCGDGKKCQLNAPWGLAALSTRPTSNFSSDGKGRFAYQTRHNGKEASVYVVDTGVNNVNNELDGRFRRGPNFIKGEGNIDLNGHGTQMASIIGGNRFGVAKMVNIISVKGFDAGGASNHSILLNCLQWIWKDMDSSGNPFAHKIINLSSTFDQSNTIDEAVRSFYESRDNEADIHRNIIIRAAGNNIGADACKFSPNADGAVYIIAAHQQDKSIGNFSNVGPCTRYAAPGHRILTYNHDGSETIEYGTSIAAAFFAGGFASLLSDTDLYDGSDGSRGLGDFYDGPKNFLEANGALDLTYKGKPTKDFVRLLLPESEGYYRSPTSVEPIPQTKLATFCNGRPYNRCM